MNEYIEREKVHRLVRSLNRYACNNSDKSKYRTTVDIDAVQFGIDKIPAADVVDVRHGKWDYDISDVGWAAYSCSVCRNIITVEDYDEDLYFYCPYCGAKMDGKVGRPNE